jgi:hypothetical protein
MFQFENIQFKRGDKATNDAYVGKPGTISIDRESMNVRVHDGVTPGGLFSVTRGAAFDELAAEFIVASDSFTATMGQTVFTLTNVSLENPDRVKVKINGMQTNNWVVSGVNRITVNDSILINDTILIYQYRTLDDVVNAAVEGMDVEALLISMLQSVTNIGGINIDDILTVNSTGAFEQMVVDAIGSALGESGSLANLVTTDTLQSAINGIDITAAVRRVLDGIPDVDYPITHVLTTADNIDLGHMEFVFDGNESLDPSVPNDTLTVFDRIDFGIVN